MTETLLHVVTGALEDLKGNDIKVLDVSKLTSITDNMVICSARSTRHLKALADEVTVKAKASGEQPLSVTGTQASGWILVDLNTVVAHIMLPETREFYNLEKLWEID